MKPAVSVIIANFNYGKYVGQAIESVLNQTLGDFELIVVDDCSTDNSVEVIENYKDKIKFIKRTLNSGIPSIPRNMALSEAAGEFVAFLDSDDTWKKEKLQLQVDYLRQHPDVGLAYTDYEVVNDKGDIIAASGNRHFNRRSVGGWVFSELISRNFIFFSSVILRKEVLNEVGSFDSQLVRAVDYDLWLRVSRHFKVGFIDKPLAQNRRHLWNRTNNQLNFEVTSLEILHKITRLYPQIKQEIPEILEASLKKRSGQLYYHKAVKCLETGDFKKARQCFASAIKYQPFQLSLYFYYLVSLFGQPALIPYARSVKRTLYG